MRNSLRSQNVLVTGSAGFIGSHLCEELVCKYNCNVTGVDSFFLGRHENVSHLASTGRFAQLTGDVRDKTLLREILVSRKIESVFHLATEPIGQSFIHPASCIEVSVLSIVCLLELQRMDCFKTLINFSTSEVYGDLNGKTCFSSQDPLRPLSTYASGKASADLILESYVSSFSLDSYIVRPFNNYGPKQNFRTELAGLIPNTIVRILQGKSPVIKGTGEQIREFVYVRDCVKAALASMNTCAPGEVLTIGSGTRLSVNNVVRMICSLMGYTGQIEYQESRPADAMEHKSDVVPFGNTEREEGTDFEVGLTDTIAYYRDEFSHSIGSPFYMRSPESDFEDR